MPTLSERSRELRERRGELAALFEKHRQGDTYDMPVEVVEEVNRRNAELDTLGRAFADAKGLAAVAEQNAAALAQMKEIARPAFPADDRLGTPAVAQKSLGEHFVESRTFKEYAGGRGPVAEIGGFDLKTLFATTAGWAPESLRIRPFLLSARERIAVVDLIPKTETGQAAVKYMEETTFTNNAAETAEAGTYPESALATTEQSSTVRKIAVSLPVTDEQFEDEPRARDYVNNRLLYMINARLDQQILTGDGTSPNLRGILNVSGINTQAKSTDPTPDAIYKGIVLVRTLGFTEPTGIVMHPSDWQDIKLLRTADGIYIWGNPSERGPESIWGLPVVQTTFETQNTAVLGDFAQFSELALRRGLEFEVSNSHSTFFVEGKQMIRASFRAALIFYRPKAFCTITGI